MALLAALILPQVRVTRVDQLPLRTTDLVTWLRTRMLCLRPDAHIAVGIASARRMEDFYALGRKTVLTIYNGVPDLEPQTKSSVPPDLGRSRLRAVSVGRLDLMKGHDLLLQAIAQIEAVELVILGEGAYRPALEQMVTDLNLSQRVALPGWSHQPRQALEQFDIVVQPSRSEGFPLTVAEAMLAALPVIATQVGSIVEAIEDGKTGLRLPLTV